MVRSQKQRGSGRSRCPITIGNGACRCRADAITARSGGGTLHCSNDLIGDLQSNLLNRSGKPPYSGDQLIPVGGMLSTVFRLSSLSCTHVVFSGAVFRRAWFSCGVQGARYWRQNRWKADRRFQDESKGGSGARKPALCAANRRIAAVMTSGTTGHTYRLHSSPPSNLSRLFAKFEYRRCGVMITGLQRRQTGGKLPSIASVADRGIQRMGGIHEQE